MGETYFPVLGGIQGLGTNHGQLKATQFVHLDAKEAAAKADIFRTFKNISFGGDAPEQFFAYRQTVPDEDGGRPAGDLARAMDRLPGSQPGRCVYIGSHDPSDRPIVAQMRLVPSGASLREDGNWPRPDELRGQPVGVEFAFVDCNGGKAGKNYQAAPVFVRFHDGDWRERRRSTSDGKRARILPLARRTNDHFPSNPSPFQGNHSMKHTLTLLAALVSSLPLVAAEPAGPAPSQPGRRAQGRLLRHPL